MVVLVDVNAIGQLNAVIIAHIVALRATFGIGIADREGSRILFAEEDVVWIRISKTCNIFPWFICTVDKLIDVVVKLTYNRNAGIRNI